MLSSRLYFLFILLITLGFQAFGAKALSYAEARARSGILVVRTIDLNDSDYYYIVVCNAVLKNSQTVISNFHCQYGEHEFTGSDQRLKKLSRDYVEDAFFILGEEHIQIPEDDYEFDQLVRNSRYRVRVFPKKFSSQSIKINNDVVEFKTSQKVVVSHNESDIEVSSPSSGALHLLGYIAQGRDMVRFDKMVNSSPSKYGGYNYKLSLENTSRSSGAPLFHKINGRYYLSGLHNGSSLNDPYKKHAVKLSR